MTSREVARAARRLADQQKALATAPPPGMPFIATVTTVTAGGAADGNALVKVTYRGNEVTVDGYHRGYVPAVGDRVEVVYLQGQLIVRDALVGGR